MVTLNISHIVTMAPFSEASIIYTNYLSTYLYCPNDITPTPHLKLSILQQDRMFVDPHCYHRYG